MDFRGNDVEAPVIRRRVLTRRLRHWRVESTLEMGFFGQIGKGVAGKKMSGGADPFRGGGPPKISNFGQIIRVPPCELF